MPRYCAVTRPAARNLVVELDDLLVALVREHLPWPREQSHPRPDRRTPGRLWTGSRRTTPTFWCSMCSPGPAPPDR